MPTNKNLVAPREPGVDTASEVNRWRQRVTELLNRDDTDYLLEVAKGNVRGHSIYRKFGRIDAILATTPADVWEYGITTGAEEYTFSTTAAIDTISSSNAADNELLYVEGLDIDYKTVIQTINLNGQNKVTLATPLFRFNRAFNANGTNFLGSVYIYEDTAIVAGSPTDVTKVRGFISANGQQTLQGVYTVPAGSDAYLYELKTAMGGRKSGFATYEAFLRPVNGVFLIKDTHDLTATGTSYRTDVFSAPRKFPAKTDFKPKITVDTNGIGFSIAFVLVLVEEGF
jgi:hypothetical protein